ncbi:hypothetical protein L1987_80910 [Smallanthus sonchifolius]|uniref:Uncharacterized protein n=1 Tax=Smallanthus sonchifolius TaxID=185202 RepID=A0ACB8YP35_9ASTR|nr:hypothetical protein L1987_80910 [Smallanthus sonchifolius]
MNLEQRSVNRGGVCLCKASDFPITDLRREEDRRSRTFLSGIELGAEFVMEDVCVFTHAETLSLSPLFSLSLSDEDAQRSCNETTDLTGKTIKMPMVNQSEACHAVSRLRRRFGVCVCLTVLQCSSDDPENYLVGHPPTHCRRLPILFFRALVNPPNPPVVSGFKRGTGYG